MNFSIDCTNFFRDDLFLRCTPSPARLLSRLTRAPLSCRTPSAVDSNRRGHSGLCVSTIFENTMSHDVADFTPSNLVFPAEILARFFDASPCSQEQCDARLYDFCRSQALKGVS